MSRSATTEADERAAVVAQARRWIGTPYHHNAAVMGAGIDCGRILIEAFAGAGMIDRFTPQPYSHQWHLHQGAEVYADIVLGFATEVAYAPPMPPATVLLFRHGRTFSHGALVTDWPNIIHAYAAADRVEEVSIEGTPLLTLGAGARPIRAFDYWQGR